MTRIAIGALALALVTSAPGCAGTQHGGNRLRFTGEVVSSEDLNIVVGPDAKKRMIAVLSPRFRYALLLPYRTDWEFFQEGGALLRGNAGLLNLTVAAFKSDEAPDAHLAEKRELLRTTKAGTGIKKMEIVTYKGSPVLRNEVDAGAFAEQWKGVTVVHYFGSKSAKGILYEYHLSEVVDPKKAGSFDDERGLWSVTKGFEVGGAAGEKLLKSPEKPDRT